MTQATGTGPLPVVAPMLVVAGIVPRALVSDGPAAGQTCGTVLLGGCNLACTWCDVPWTWDPAYHVEQPLGRRVVHHVVDEVLADGAGLVVVSGGEPLVQQRTPGWTALLDQLGRRAAVEVHTNGTVVPTAATVGAVHRFVVSPKLAHCGEPAWVRRNDDALMVWAEQARERRASFTFVVRGREDLLTVEQLATLVGLPRETIWISPEGRTTAEVLAGVEGLRDAVTEHRFHLAVRIPAGR